MTRPRLRQAGFDFGRDFAGGFALTIQEPAPARLAPAQEPATDPRQVDAFPDLDDAQEPVQEISDRRREFIQEEARPRFCHQCGEPVTKKPGKNPGTVLVCCTWEACPFHLNGYSDVGIPDPEPEPELAPACPACGTRHALEFADRPCSGCRLLRTASRLAGDEPEPEPEPEPSS